MTRPLYVDLDDSLIASDIDGGGNVVKIIPRPGVDAFLKNLSKHGDLYLLTHATRPHVKDAFKAIGPASRLFKAVISRENMKPVIDEIDIISGSDISDGEKDFLYKQIRPLFRSGYIFDDQPVGSGLYVIKAAVVGASPEDWIRVRPFTDLATGRSGLERAYAEYLARNDRQGPVMSGRAVRVAR